MLFEYFYMYIFVKYRSMYTLKKRFTWRSSFYTESFFYNNIYAETRSLTLESMQRYTNTFSCCLVYFPKYFHIKSERKSSNFLFVFLFQDVSEHQSSKRAQERKNPKRRTCEKHDTLQINWKNCAIQEFL